jgi:hypothetical protein
MKIKNHALEFMSENKLFKVFVGNNRIHPKLLIIYKPFKTKFKCGERPYSPTLGFGGVSISPGDWLYSDEDGIVIAKRQLPVE